MGQENGKEQDIKLMNGFRRLELSMDSMTIFKDVAKDITVRNFKNLLNCLALEETNIEQIFRHYFIFYNSLKENNWQDYLVELILCSSNSFARKAAIADDGEIDGSLRLKAKRDIRIIKEASEVSSEGIIEFVQGRIAENNNANEIFTGSIDPKNWPVWENTVKYKLINNSHDAMAVQWLNNKKSALKKEFKAQNDWGNIFDKLAEYYTEVGWGIFSKYMVFNFSEKTEDKLEGIEKPDPITLNKLIAQEREQKIILDNTEFFLKGYPANNIILYGNRGTGKSSLVKALQNEYAARKLRIVQLKKSQIGFFPEFVQILDRLPFKFIIFIDDLSFDNMEQDYKNLKSLLEGGVEARPENVIIYATSNRRHLVKETFDERSGEEVHVRDNIEEKLSLADRFGITVTFLSPDQKSYLRIVEGLASQEGISLDIEELRQRALKWVMMHNGRSGRTARQFIDHLKGELEINNNR